jgi:hypothetical protein
VKKIASILLLALLLYNAFGYYLLFAYQKGQQQDMSVYILPESAFDVLKFNVAIYTSKENTDFEYLNDALEVQGKNYQIVKKRIHNDSLEMYYLRDYRKDALRQNLNDIVESQTFNNLNNSSSKETPIKQLLKSFLKEYVSNDIYILVDCCPKTKVSESVKIPAAPAEALRSAYLSLISPPPEVA